MVTLNVGTKEIVSVLLEDRLNSIATLDPYVVQYRIRNEQEVDQVPWATVLDTTDMRVDILIDTTVGTWAEGVYKLDIRPQIAPEAPILGPILFGLS